MKFRTLKNCFLLVISMCALACSGGGDIIGGDDNNPDNGNTSDPSQKISVSIKEINTSVLGETLSFSLESTGDWEASTSEPIDWITLSQSMGFEGVYDIDMTIKPNTGDKARTAEILFTCGSKSAKIKVSQEWSQFFKVPCTSYKISYAGGRVVIDGLPKTDFTITIPAEAQEWISASGNCLDVAFNDNADARKTKISITDNTIPKTYEVNLTQSGIGNMTLSELCIDGYKCPTDKLGVVKDFLYSVDDEATTTKPVKVEYLGEGVQWITIGDDNKKIFSGDMVTFTNMKPGANITIHAHNEITDKIGVNTLMITCLPIVTITTQSPIQDEPKVDCTIAIFDPKKRTDAGEENNLEYFKSKAGIEWRGAGALRYPKKAYNFKLYDSVGDKREAELLNIRNDNSWILDAMYLDMGRMRNRICFDLWNSFNKPYYVSEKPKAMSGTRGHYVEVFINGQYMGFFALSDRIDRKQYQIEQNGGYIYKAKGWTQACYLQGYSARSSNDDYYWNSAEIEQEYPGEGDGAPNFNHMADFIDFVSKTSKAEFNAQFANRVAENSVIDTFIFLNLILAYDNAGRNTFWIYRNINESKKMIHGLWDLDGSLGRDWNRVKTSSSNGWFYGNSNNPGGNNYFKLFKRIMDGDVEGLQQKIYDRWVELKNNQLAPAEFNKLVDYYSELQIVSGARDREVARWRAEETKDAITGTNGWVHYSGNYGDVEGERDYMKQWYKERVERLDQMLSTYNSK